MDTLIKLFAPFLTADLVGRLVRTALQSAGAAAAGAGYINGDQSTALVGAGVTIVTTIWTAFASRKQAITLQGAALGLQ